MYNNCARAENSCSQGDAMRLYILLDSTALLQGYIIPGT